MQDPQVKIEQTPETQIEKGEEKHSKPYLRKQPRVLLKNQKKDGISHNLNTKYLIIQDCTFQTSFRLGLLTGQ